ncbi:MAG: hypothetical protein JW751_28350 [Polyangiaceae bacterium]|nr:hypothetical protein [Polyangiaceae bacterium]
MTDRSTYGAWRAGAIVAVCLGGFGCTAGPDPARITTGVVVQQADGTMEVRTNAVVVDHPALTEIGHAPDYSWNSYSLDVSSAAVAAIGASGLRRVNDVLEFLDASGTPILRFDPSDYYDGWDDVLRLATLEVTGCLLDTNPAPPWGRAVTPPVASTCTLTIRWEEVFFSQIPTLVANSWTTPGCLTRSRARHLATRLEDGRVLVAGGELGSRPLATAELYDPETGTWTGTGALATARTLFGSVELEDHRILVAGGWGPSGRLASAELYDPSTGT